MGERQEGTETATADDIIQEHTGGHYCRTREHVLVEEILRLRQLKNQLLVELDRKRQVRRWAE